MKKILLSMTVLALGAASLFTSCSDDSDDTESTLQTSLTGTAEKGIFMAGSTVKLYVYTDNTFSTLLDSATVTITSSDGSYTITHNIKSKYIKVVVSGTFLDETLDTDESVSGEITAIADASEGKTVNVNALTDMESEAAIESVKKGTSIKDAKKAALDAVLLSMGLTQAEADSIKTKGADKIRLGDGSKAGDALLKVSASILELAAVEGDFQAYVDKLKTNVKEGKATEMLAELKGKVEQVDVDGIKANIERQKNGKTGL